MLVPLAFCLAAACTDDGALLGSGPEPARQRPAQSEGLRWSDRKSWPDNHVPTAGADVVIPEGRRILLDVTPPELRSLVVRGTLALPTGDVAPRALVAGHIAVHGRLEVGTEDRPYQGRLTITLTGRSDAPALAFKALSVYPGAELDLHSAPRLSWTRLAETAEPGATRLVLAAAPDWRPGDRIVVAPSGRTQDEAETRIVRAVDGATVTLDAPLAHRHVGGPLRIAGIDVERRAEVGLLTRGIRIEGDPSSEESGIGGHVIVYRGGVARVDGVEFHRMGQRGELARYPMHWHMADRAPGQYIVRSSVWRSFNRCVTVHGTHDVTVAENVCYDHTGHGYFLEDGIETNNTIEGNLGLVSRAGSVIPSDASPATYWITHPDNTVERNVAAGSAGHGFWYALQDHPTGPSATTSVWPRFTPLRSFRDNLAHSIHDDALHVEGADAPGSYAPRAGGVPGATPVVATFDRFTAYNSRRAFWSRGDYHRVRDPHFFDNQVALQAGEAGGHAEGELEGGLIAGWSSAGAADGPPSRHGVLLYDGPVRVRGVTFANFDRDGSAALSGVQLSSVVSGRFSVEGSRFVDARPVLLSPDPADGARMMQVLDRDGSMTGAAGTWVVASDDFLAGAECEARPDWNARVCPGDFAAIGMHGEGASASVTVRSDDGRETRFQGAVPGYVQIPVRTRQGYTVRPDVPATGDVMLNAEGLAPGVWVEVAVPVAGTIAEVVLPEHDHARIPLVESLGALRDSGAAAAHVDEATGLVRVRLVGIEGDESLRVTIRVD